MATVALVAAAHPARAQVARFRTLHSFSAVASSLDPSPNTNAEGANPEAGLILGLDGNFYGTASAGGGNTNGTVFRCTPGGTVSAVYTFSAFDSTNSGTNQDGAVSEAALIQDGAGNLYGIAAQGGADGAGTAFEVTLAGGFTDLHDFAFGDGAGPAGPLLLTPDGLLAGTATMAGDSDGDGTFFFLEGTSFGPALDFSGGLGTYPIGPLAFDNPPGAQFPTIYGACEYGGNTGSSDPLGSGVIFGLPGAAPGGALETVYAFSVLDSNLENTDGAHPLGGVLLGRDGNLYGTTSSGGPNQNGTVWQLVLDPATGEGTAFNVLHPFAEGDGKDCHAPLVEGSDGNFYGTAEYGGATGNGVVFRVTPAKGYTVLHSFSDVDSNNANGDGVVPFGGLVEVRPGSFVGTAFYGGVNGNGTIFELDVAPVITSAATATGNAGSAFVYQITAADGPGSYSVGGLGDGLQFNAATGLISGTPTAAGTLKLTVGASNDVGTGSKVVTVTIKGPVPVITSAGTATAQVGVAFSYQITASHSPTSYGVLGLRPGLSVNKTTGLITGTPAGAGTFTLTLQAANAGGTGTKTLTLTIKPGKPVINSPATATATVGKPFSYQIEATGSPTSYGVLGLFGGITVNKQTGLISGTPTGSEVGKHTLILQAANAGGTGTQPLTLTVAAQ